MVDLNQMLRRMLFGVCDLYRRLSEAIQCDSVCQMAIVLTVCVDCVFNAHSKETFDDDQNVCKYI